MKSLDLTKFYASNFYEHFFELVKKYDGIFSTNYYAEATTWIANYNFDAIYNFLEPFCITFYLQWIYWSD